MNHVALRVQNLESHEQALILADLAGRRSNGSRVAPADVEEMFHSLALPLSGRVSNLLQSLERHGFMSRRPGRGAVWAVAPSGKRRLQDLVSDLDVVVLAAAIDANGGSNLGHTVHPVVPPSLAPPGIVRPVLDFLSEYDFDTNVFAMTRFPSEEDADPLEPAIDVARTTCRRHGLNLILASDRSLVDDLWANVSAHMWASRYGIAFFENRRRRGINHNMTIEVGAMLMSGRRCALLKDRTIQGMPTDLVGHIYRSVDLDIPTSVETEIESWIVSDLQIGGRE